MNIVNFSCIYIKSLALGQKKGGGREWVNIANATAFIAQTPEGIDCLITNRHVVTALDSENKNLYKHTYLPSSLEFYLIANNGKEFIRYWHPFIMQLNKINSRDELYEKDYEPSFLKQDRIWIEHPILKNNADFVAIPIHKSFLNSLNNSEMFKPSNIQFDFIRINMFENDEFILEPSDKIEVIGFPLGLTISENESHWHKEYFPIWISGYIASDPNIKFDGKPMFLIDSRTKGGNSGSPVFIIKNNENKVAKFLGIYSGRIVEKNKSECEISDLGKVWTKNSIKELLLYVDQLNNKNQLNYSFIEPLTYLSTSNEIFIDKLSKEFNKENSFFKEIYCFDKFFNNKYHFDNNEQKKNKWYFFTKNSRFKLIGMNKQYKNCYLDENNIEWECSIADLPFELIKEENNLKNDGELNEFINKKINYELKLKLIKFNEWCCESHYNWINEKYLKILN